MKILISQRDFLGFQRLHSAFEKKHIIFLSVLTFLWIIFVVLSSTFPFIIVIFGTIGAILGVSIYRYVYLTYKSNKVYKQQKALQKGFELFVDDYGVRIEAENGQSHTPWSEFIKYKENKCFLLLYYSDVLFLMIPKLQVSDKELETISKNLDKIES